MMLEGNAPLRVVSAEDSSSLCASIAIEKWWPVLDETAAVATQHRTTFDMDPSSAGANLMSESVAKKKRPTCPGLRADSGVNFALTSLTPPTVQAIPRR